MESIPSPEKMKITIERAEPHDAEEIQTVFYKTWLATYPNTVPGVSVEDVQGYYKDKLSTEGIQKYKKRIEGELKLENQRFFVARVDKKIVGASLAFRQEEKNQLKAIYVLPEFQGAGIGYKLWGEVLNSLIRLKIQQLRLLFITTMLLNFTNDLVLRIQEGDGQMKSL